MKKYTNKELGEILANETLSLSSMWMEANKKKSIDKQYWMMIHLGFIAGLKLFGKTDKDIESILNTAQKELLKDK